MYDFTTRVDRMKNCSSKWMKMIAGGNTPTPGVMPMTVADLDFVNCPEIADAICEYAKNEVLGYNRPTPEYLNSVVKFLKSYHNYECDPQWIVTTPGIVPALSNAVRSFTKPGEGILLMTPIYPPFYHVIESQGRVAELCPLKLEQGKYNIDFELLEALAKKDSTTMLLFCSPHNPGGRIWTVDELRRLSDICLKYGILVVCDEIHADIMLTEKRHTMLGNIGKDIEKKAIICTAASKSFNIAGLQCSNIIIRDEELRNHFIEVHEALGIERANILGMVATQAAYERAEKWLEEMLEVIRENVWIVKEFFNKYPLSFEVMEPEAGFLVWVDCKGMGYREKELSEFLRKCEFYINDGGEYGAGGEGFIRINVGLPTDALKENLDRLGQGLEDLGIEK